MSTIETRYEHVVLNESSVPLIAGTTMKVIELVLEHMSYGWSPEELQRNHPYLSMGKFIPRLRTTEITTRNWIKTYSAVWIRLTSCARP
jgi:hypothetical protein